MARTTPPDGQSEPAGPPNWGPRRPWEVEPTPTNTGKWLTVAAAVVAVLALIGSVTVYLTDGDEPAAGAASATSPEPVKPMTPSANADFASAKDISPVAVVTDDPTCTAWTSIDEALAASEQTSWSGRDPSISASAWTPSRRDSYDAVATAMRTAADQIAPLARQTPHRVMRELYEQTGAYLTAYAGAMPTYTAVDDHLAQAAAAASSAVSSICESIGSGSAAARAGLAPPAANPTASIAASDEQTFLQPPADPACGQWHALVAKYTTGFAAWRALDPNTAAAQWTAAQRAVADAVRPVMVAFADEATGLAAESPNGVLQDFLNVAAQYRRAYAAALPTYVAADGALTRTASAMTGAIDEGCLAIEG